MPKTVAVLVALTAHVRGDTGRVLRRCQLLAVAEQNVAVLSAIPRNMSEVPHLGQVQQPCDPELRADREDTGNGLPIMPDKSMLPSMKTSPTRSLFCR
jgi:hypothetical protein